MKASQLRLNAGLTLAAAALLSAPGISRAEAIYGLTTTGSLFSFDSATPGTTSTLNAISGVTAGQTLVGMDFRPATGQLFALSYESTNGTAQLYTLNLANAAATRVGTGFTLQSGIQNGRFGFDFNPTVDRIRAIGGYGADASTSGANYRLNPLNGTIAATDTNAAFAPSDTNVGTNPNVAGLAYTNNFAGATTTTLYGYEYTTDSLVTVGGINGNPSPNGGALTTIGVSGLTTNTATLDLDISATGTAYGNFDTATTNDSLYTINLATGRATSVGQIGTGIQVLDIAVQVPEPGTYVLVGLGLGALVIGARRRRTAQAAV